MYENKCANGAGQSENLIRKLSKFEYLVNRRNTLQSQLHKVEKQIELAHKNPVIMEFLELD